MIEVTVHEIRTHFARRQKVRDFSYCRRMLFSDESMLIGLEVVVGSACYDGETKNYSNIVAHFSRVVEIQLLRGVL